MSNASLIADLEGTVKGEVGLFDQFPKSVAAIFGQGAVVSAAFKLAVTKEVLGKFFLCTPLPCLKRYGMLQGSLFFV